MKLTRKGRRILERHAAERVLAEIYIARRLGVLKVWTQVKRKDDYVFEITVKRPRGEGKP